MPGGIFQGIPQVFFLRAAVCTPSCTFETFLLFQSTMNFNFVENHVFTRLAISLNIYFNFASLVDFLGPEISVWKVWPKIPLTLCTKLWGPVAPPKLFSIFFSYFAGRILLPKWTKWGGVPKKNTIFIFVNHPNKHVTFKVQYETFKIFQRLQDNFKICTYNSWVYTEIKPCICVMTFKCSYECE